MPIAQDQADKFGQSLKTFHDSLADDEKQVLEHILEQAAASQDRQEEAPKGKPFFERFLVLNPEGAGQTDPGQFVTLKFPSDSDESAAY